MQTDLSRTVHLLHRWDEQLAKDREENVQLRSAVAELGEHVHRLHHQESLESGLKININSEILQTVTHLAVQVQQLDSLVQSIPRQNRVLEKLKFQAIFSREYYNLGSAVGDTFSWIFDHGGSPSERNSCLDDDNGSLSEADLANQISEQPGQKRIYIEFQDPETRRRQEAATSVREFLLHSQPTLFIAGNPGCGKSTFLKYVANHHITKGKLLEWADTCKLVVIKHFFWRSDNNQQNSIEGFFRSVLYQVLGQCPELIPDVFPNESGRSTSSDAVEFLATETEDAFTRLLRLDTAGRYSFCCFIDGLDEHQGDNVDHKKLADLLLLWASLDNVKIMCSARPYTVFLDAFRGTAQILEFHQLTKSDISSFATTRFYGPELVAEDMWAARDICLSLVEEITRRAEGVFIWATIVVRALINLALDHESEKKAFERCLEEYPDSSELDKALKQILDRVDSTHSKEIRTRSNLILYLAAHNPFQLPLNALIYSWLDELDWLRGPLDRPCSLDRSEQLYSEGYIQPKKDRIEVLLRQLTQGLLQVVDTNDSVPYFRYRVEFYHASVRDFLLNQWTSGARPNPFPTRTEEVEAYCRLRSLEAKCLKGVLVLHRTSLLNEERRPARDVSQSLLENLRLLFEYTFLWLADCNAKGTKAPNWCIQDFGTILHQISPHVSPFLLGRLLITEEDSRRWYTRYSDGEPCSYLYWAAYWAQSSYVKNNVPLSEWKPDSVVAPRLNLLLSTSLASDVTTTEFLLKEHFKPSNRIAIKPTEITMPNGGLLGADHPPLRNDSKDLHTASVWAVFLRDLAINVRVYCWKRRVASSWPFYLDREWLERLSQIAELHLKAGADASVFFLIRMEDPDGGGTYRTSLYQLLDTFKPRNMETLGALLPGIGTQGAGGWTSSSWSSWWEVVAKTKKPYTSPWAKYPSPTLDMLINNQWRMLGVCSNSSGKDLIGPFEVRVF